MWWKEHFPVRVLKPNCSWPWINHWTSLGLIFLLCKINCLNWLSLCQFSQSFTCLPLLLRGERWRLCGVSVPLVKDRLTPVLPPLPAGHSTHSGVPAVWLASTCTRGPRADPYQLQRFSSEVGNGPGSQNSPCWFQSEYRCFSNKCDISQDSLTCPVSLFLISSVFLSKWRPDLSK